MGEHGSIIEVVFNYLDRNTTIVNSEIHIEDESAPRIATIFGTDDVDFHDWAMDRVGENYCLITNDGAIIHYKNGLPHNDHLPTIVDNKNRFWFKDGKLHRDDDEPAFIYGEVGIGTYAIEWFKNGKLHRDNDKPAIIHRIITNGTDVLNMNDSRVYELFQQQWWVEDEYIRMNLDSSSGMRFTSRGKGSLGLLTKKDYTLTAIKLKPHNLKNL